MVGKSFIQGDILQLRCDVDTQRSDNVFHAASRFIEEEQICCVSSLGDGNIHDTYLVEGRKNSIVIQRLNQRVFAEPIHLVDNFARVTRYIHKRVGESHSQWECIYLYPTLTGDIYYLDSSNHVWRAQNYLHDTTTYSSNLSLQQVQQVGWALGKFHDLLRDLPLDNLHTAIPGFHYLPGYILRYNRVLGGHQKPLSSLLAFCFDTIRKQAISPYIIEQPKNEGKLSIQVIHGDPKADNVVFRDGQKAISLIDLDTVGHGPIHYDIGDCLRSCCNSLGELEGGEGDVVFDLGLCQGLLQGYYNGASSLVTQQDKKYIFQSVVAITYELGIRFLTDYLEGNVYFKVREEGENLQRAVQQFRLLNNILIQEKEIRKIAER